jgi:hypothetical protein
MKHWEIISDQDENLFWLLHATRERWSVDLFKTDAGEIARAKLKLSPKEKRKIQCKN